jgi:hypothetical protein
MNDTGETLARVFGHNGAIILLDLEKRYHSHVDSYSRDGNRYCVIGLYTWHKELLPHLSRYQFVREVHTLIRLGAVRALERHRASTVYAPDIDAINALIQAHYEHAQTHI